MWTKLFGKVAALQQNALTILGKLAEEMKLNEQILVWLLTPEGVRALERACRQVLDELEVVWEDSLRLLELVGTVVVPATTGNFVAKEKFVVNTECDAPVKICFVGANFTNWFLSGDSKTEDLISEQTLQYHKLRKMSVDGPIITELGGEAKVETTLLEMFSLMERQKHGEDGVLLNNNYASIFYIRDQSDILRSVKLRWDDNGWSVDVDPVDYKYRWEIYDQVFSRK